MEKVTEATLHLEKVTEAMAKCNLSLEYLKVTEAMAKCNRSLNYSQKIFWLDWTIVTSTFIKKKLHTYYIYNQFLPRMSIIQMNIYYLSK